MILALLQGCRLSQVTGIGGGERPDAPADTNAQEAFPAWVRGAVILPERCRDPSQATKVLIRGSYIPEGDLAVLRRMPYLEELVLVGDNLTDGALVYVQGLERLHTLTLAFAITPRGWTILRGMPALRSLWIAGCPSLKSTDIDELVRLDQIESLGVSARQMPEGALGRLKTMRGLRELEISINLNDERNVRLLGEFAHLESLKLYLRGPARDRDFSCLAGLRNVTRLDLPFKPVVGVGDAGVAHLAEMTRLRILHLEGTSITGAGLIALAKMQELEELYLDETRIDDEGLARLRGLKKLRHLSLLDCLSVTEAGLAHLTSLDNLKCLVLSEDRQFWGTDDYEFAPLVDREKVERLLGGMKGLEIVWRNHERERYWVFPGTHKFTPVGPKDKPTKWVYPSKRSD